MTKKIVQKKLGCFSGSSPLSLYSHFSFHTCCFVFLLCSFRSEKKDKQEAVGTKLREERNRRGARKASLRLQVYNIQTKITKTQNYRRDSTEIQHERFNRDRSNIQLSENRKTLKSTPEPPPPAGGAALARSIQSKD